MLPGLPLYVIPDKTIYDPKQLCDFLETNRITRILFTPSLLEAILDCDTVDMQKAFKSLRSVSGFWWQFHVIKVSFRSTRSVLNCHDQYYGTGVSQVLDTGVSVKPLSHSCCFGLLNLVSVRSLLTVNLKLLMLFSYMSPRLVISCHLC